MSSISDTICNLNQKLTYAALADLQGEIAIVWDRHISRQFTTFVTLDNLLLNCGVTKNFFLDKELPVAVCDLIHHVVYFITPLNESVTKLIKHFPIHTNDNKISYHVFFIPDANYMLKERLRACPHVWKYVENNIRSIPCHWFADDQLNFLQMALPELPAHMQLDGDWNYLYKCATALTQFRRLFLSSFSSVPSSTDGKVKDATKCRPIDIFCHGKWAERIADMMQKMNDQEEAKDVKVNANTFQFAGIDTIVVIDRWTDVVTPMLMPYTLGGAIDELFEIGFRGKTKMTYKMLNDLEVGDDDVAEATVLSEAPKFVELSGEIHKRLHDLHIFELSSEIRDLVAEMKEEELNLKHLRFIADYRNFVNERMQQQINFRAWTDKFLKIAALVQHRYADFFFGDMVQCQKEILLNSLSGGFGGDRPLPFIETAIADAREPHLVLRLIVLQSVVATRGLRPQVLAVYRKAFVQSYGVFALKWWMKLQVAGLIREDSIDHQSHRFEMYPPMNYTQMAKRFHLIQPNFNENKVTDSAYAFNGYASLLVRLMEEGIMDNWRDFKKMSVSPSNGNKISVGDPSIESDDRPTGKSPLESGGIVPASIVASFSALGLKSVERSRRSSRRIMLFVVGGMTRAETGALRHLYADNIKIFTTTATITAKSLLESFK